MRLGSKETGLFCVLFVVDPGFSGTVLVFKNWMLSTMMELKGSGLERAL